MSLISFECKLSEISKKVSHIRQMLFPLSLHTYQNLTTKQTKEFYNETERFSLVFDYSIDPYFPLGIVLHLGGA